MPTALHPLTDVALAPASPAGHMVPQSKPAEALEMFSRFLERMQI